MARQQSNNRAISYCWIKRMRTVIMFLVMGLALPGGASHIDNKGCKDLYADKAFYFAAWGGPGSGSTDEQLARMKQCADAGITDILPGDGVARLKELIAMGKPLGIRVHAWH